VNPYRLQNEQHMIEEYDVQRRRLVNFIPEPNRSRGAKIGSLLGPFNLGCTWALVNSFHYASCPYTPDSKLLSKHEKYKKASSLYCDGPLNDRSQHTLLRSAHTLKKEKTKENKRKKT